MFKRLQLFIFGALLGSLIAYFALIRGKSKLFEGFTPNSRVMLYVKASFSTENPTNACYIKCLNIDTTEMLRILDDASVIFNKSEPRQKPAVFVIEDELENKSRIELRFHVADSVAVIQNVMINNSTINCNCE
jgi:hypothetical protein